MRITTKGCYGMRAMIELASAEDGTPVSMEHIAESRDISRKYLHALLTSLRSAGLVRSVRGPGGGYVLAKRADDISIGDILEALESTMAPASCVDEPDLCSRSGFCPMVPLWNQIAEITGKILYGVSLAQVVQDEANRRG